MQELYNLKIFSGIEKKDVDKIVSKLERESFATGEIIMNKGDKSNGKGYIIISGGVDILDGSKKIASLSVGDIFGEIALLNEEERTATVVANSPLETLVITQETILEIMSNDNYLNKEIMKRVQENIENNR